MGVEILELINWGLAYLVLFTVLVSRKWRHYNWLLFYTLSSAIGITLAKTYFNNWYFHLGYYSINSVLLLAAYFQLKYSRLRRLSFFSWIILPIIVLIRHIPVDWYTKVLVPHLAVNLVIILASKGVFKSQNFCLSVLTVNAYVTVINTVAYYFNPFPELTAYFTWIGLLTFAVSNSALVLTTAFKTSFNKLSWERLKSKCPPIILTNLLQCEDFLRRLTLGTKRNPFK